MVRWRCFYHAIWATKNRLPQLDPAWDTRLSALSRFAAEQGQAELLAFGAASDHVHVLYSAPPHIAPMDIVRRIKSATATVINRELLVDFRWQEGYMLRTIDERSLSQIRAYVLNQRNHHKSHGSSDEPNDS